MEFISNNWHAYCRAIKVTDLVNSMTARHCAMYIRMTCQTIICPFRFLAATSFLLGSFYSQHQQVTVAKTPHKVHPDFTQSSAMQKIPRRRNNDHFMRNILTLAIPKYFWLLLLPTEGQFSQLLFYLIRNYHGRLVR